MSIEVIPRQGTTEVITMEGTAKFEGDVGPRGPQGPKGDKGDTGERGPQGIQGPQGNVGPQGQKGDKGDRGEQGDKGDTGSQGPQGLQGIQGPKGDTGEQGIQGPKGDKGDTGEQGIQGIPGNPGDDGFSPTVATSKVDKVTTITITDVQGTHTATIRDGEDGQGSGDMLKAVYDTDNDGIVDNAEKVNNHTVNADVPSNAEFTDTTDHSLLTNLSYANSGHTGFQDTLVSGTNIKTINSNSILGSGNIEIQSGGGTWGSITGTLSNQTDLNTALTNKVGNDANTNTPIYNVWYGTQAQYEAITTKDLNTLYYTPEE